MPRRPVRAALAALAVALSAAGCVSMPSGGPVVSYPITQQPDLQNQNYVQIDPPPPGKNWQPKQIVEGFLTAAASFGNYDQVAQEYLTPNGRKTWNPRWSAIVYKKGPNVENPKISPPAGPGKLKSATVSVSGTVEASLKGFGTYSVSSASTPSAADDPEAFTLVQEKNGQWRIDHAPGELLLTSDSFANDYELRRLYFFDPMTRHLVPDPVYVPLKSKLGDLVNGLVHDLIAPPSDWLSFGATRTAIPDGTKILSVALSGGAAVVNLGGSIAKAGNDVKQQVSAQLLWTLIGATQSGASGAAVQSVELEINGNAWTPPGGQGNPDQQKSGAKYGPAAGLTPGFYYVDKAGYLTWQDGTKAKPVRIRYLGTGYAQMAVSPSGKYLALISGTTLFTGLLTGPLVDRGSGYKVMSWDDSDQLWVSDGSDLLMFRGGVGPQQPLGQPIPVDVISQYGQKNMTGPWTALRVAPDGVRIALVFDAVTLYIGAVSTREGQRPGQASIELRLSQVADVAPGTTEFTGLTWYGPDNVITLTNPGSAVTEYPVSGGASTSIPALPDMSTIAASSGSALIGVVRRTQLVFNNSLSGSWVPITSGTLPAYPG